MAPVEIIVPKTVIIQRVGYPKWWKNALTHPISMTGAGTQTIVGKSPSYNVFVANIVLTVSAETIISFYFGVFGSSGPIMLGGEGQPMGMVIAMGNSPAPCGEGGFSITSSLAVTVGGFVSFFYQLKE